MSNSPNAAPLAAKEMQVAKFIAWITTRDGVSRRYALVSVCLEDARREAQLLTQALCGFSFTVREEA